LIRESAYPHSAEIIHTDLTPKYTPLCLGFNDFGHSNCYEGQSEVFPFGLYTGLGEVRSPYRNFTYHDSLHAERYHRRYWCPFCEMVPLVYKFHLLGAHHDVRGNHPSLATVSTCTFKRGSQNNILRPRRRPCIQIRFLAGYPNVPQLSISPPRRSKIRYRAAIGLSSSLPCYSPPISSISVITAGEGHVLDDLCNPPYPLTSLSALDIRDVSHERRSGLQALVETYAGQISQLRLYVQTHSDRCTSLHLFHPFPSC